MAGIASAVRRTRDSRPSKPMKRVFDLRMVRILSESD
jgi:hypothetical protein